MTSTGAEPSDRLVLDTSGYSHLRAGHPHVLAWLAAAAVVSIPVIVLGELEAAFLRGTRLQENRAGLAEFLSEPFVEVLVVDQDAARRYGELVAHLRRTGTPVPVNDIWIAAITLAIGGRLLTFDRDFERIPALECTVLVQGGGERI
jgi:tRNA(fMet)-specific endonuclease VapC